ncbi:MOSC N-terminal beta barrel domain-containing protein [Acidimicrobiaceae bacterium AH-315-P05]|nr:MOSC N-terminal beta barrel domain-containing protein [Acidimicrobiaceae bacterium AH-315-P05]
MPAKILDIWRYPVKSVGGERLESADLGPAGIAGDRQWGIVDTQTGHMLTARRQPELLFASAKLVGDAVEIMLPNGTVAHTDQELSTWSGHAVSLIHRADTSEPQSYEIAEDFEDEQGSHWVNWKGQSWSFHDSAKAAVSVLSTGSIGIWDYRRFRANIIIDRPTETDLVGCQLTAGGANLEALKGIARCVMVTRPLPAAKSGRAAGRDLDILREINRHRNTILGVGCAVTMPGQVNVGDFIS